MGRPSSLACSCKDWKEDEAQNEWGIPAAVCCLRCGQACQLREAGHWVDINSRGVDIYWVLHETQGGLKTVYR